MAEFRNTIGAVFSAFFTHMKELEGTTGADSNVEIKKVAEGENLPLSHPLANVTIQLLSAKIIGRSDRDKQWQQQIKISVETEIKSADTATTEILSKTAQVENKINSFVLPDGVAGFEDSEWSVTFGTTAEHGNTVSADCTRNFTVMVSRGGN